MRPLIFCRQGVSAALRTSLFTAALVIAALLCTAGISAAADQLEKHQKIVEARMVTIWVEGAVFDDLVLNARGKLTFLYVDSKLGAGLQKLRTAGPEGDPSDAVPMLFLDYVGNYNRKKGYAMFAVYVEASKPWTFDTEQFSIGGYHPTEDDIIVGIRQDPQTEIHPGITELESGYAVFTNIFVPLEYLKPGTEIQIGYGEDLRTWKVPGKYE